VNLFALKLIKSLLSSSPRTIQELLSLTGLPERTLRYNLSILRRNGLIEELPFLRDLRKKIIILKEDPNWGVQRAEDRK